MVGKRVGEERKSRRREGGEDNTKERGGKGAGEREVKWSQFWR